MSDGMEVLGSWLGEAVVGTFDGAGVGSEVVVGSESATVGLPSMPEATSASADESTMVGAAVGKCVGAAEGAEGALV